MDSLCRFRRDVSLEQIPGYWTLSGVYKKLRITMRAIERQADLIAADHLPPPTFDIRFRRIFISIFTRLSSGVGVNQGQRDSRDQSAFRAAMIPDYGAGPIRLQVSYGAASPGDIGQRR